MICFSVPPMASVGADPDVVAAMMIAAIDQHVAGAGGTHLAEGNLLRVMGLEGMVSRESIHRGGWFDRWIKVKNRQHPAFSRVQDQF
jgi:hypothetical protein